MNYNVSSIISAVKVLLDSHGYSAAIAGTGEGQYLDDIIRSATLASARGILMSAPVFRLSELCKTLPSDSDVLAGQNAVGNRSVSIALPADFLRLVRVRLIDWLTSVWEPHAEGGPEERLQSYEGVCANPLRPVAVFGHMPDTHARAIVCWGSRATTPRWRGSGSETGWTVSAGAVKVAPFCFMIGSQYYKTPGTVEHVDVSNSELEFDIASGHLRKDGEDWTTAAPSDGIPTQCRLDTPIPVSLIEDFRYVAEPSFTTENGVQVLAFESGLYQALLYRTAGLTAAQTQEEKLSEDLLSISNTLTA